MTTPNKLTLLRIIIAPLFVYFFVIDSFVMRLIALGLFVIAALTDMIDGYLARKSGTTTSFGRFMDPLADKILVSSALISFVALDYASVYPVLIIIGREFGITGLRLLAASRGQIIAPTPGAKLKTFLQLVVVGAVLTFISLESGLRQAGNTWLERSTIDFQFYFNLAFWLTAAVTAITGLDYTVRYFATIKSALHRG